MPKFVEDWTLQVPREAMLDLHCPRLACGAVTPVVASDLKWRGDCATTRCGTCKKRLLAKLGEGTFVAPAWWQIALFTLLLWTVRVIRWVDEHAFGAVARPLGAAIQRWLHVPIFPLALGTLLVGIILWVVAPLAAVAGALGIVAGVFMAFYPFQLFVSGRGAYQWLWAMARRGENVAPATLETAAHQRMLGVDRQVFVGMFLLHLGVLVIHLTLGHLPDYSYRLFWGAHLFAIFGLHWATTDGVPPAEYRFVTWAKSSLFGGAS